MEPLFTAREVVAGYGEREVLRGAGLEVRPGELWAILGPNGAGKSTLVRVGMGLLPAWSGEVTLAGKPLAAYARTALARRIAWVPQATETVAGFTALELCLMGRSPFLGRFGVPSRHDVERAHQTLAELGIDALAARAVTRLSGGERRMVFLARALLQDPELLWLDEPTAFLDLRHQVEALERIRERTRRGMAAVAVLHDVNLALAFADRALLLGDGRVVAAGPTREVVTSGAVASLFGVRVAQAEVEGQRLLAARRQDSVVGPR